MISTGRWVIAVLFAVGGLAQIGMGVAYLLGWLKPDLEAMAFPAAEEDLVVTLVGAVSILVGALLALTAWGVYGWRSWGRILTIVLCALNLVGLVILSFQGPLQPAAIVSGVITVLLLVWLFNSRVIAAFAAGGKQG